MSRLLQCNSWILSLVRVGQLTSLQLPYNFLTRLFNGNSYLVIILFSESKSSFIYFFIEQGIYMPWQML